MMVTTENIHLTTIMNPTHLKKYTARGAEKCWIIQITGSARNAADACNAVNLSWIKMNL